MIQQETVRLAWRVMHSGMEGDAFWHGGRCILAWRAMHSGMEGDAFWYGGRCILAWRAMHSGMEGDAFSLPFPILAT